MNILLISHFAGTYQVIDSIPNSLVYMAESFGYVLFLEGYNVTRCSFNLLQNINIKDYDIVIAALAPSTAEFISNIDLPVIGVESDPDGGISCSHQSEKGSAKLLEAYNNCKYIIPLNEPTKYIFKDKISDVPIGVHTEPLNKYSGIRKRDIKTAVMCHCFRMNMGWIKTLRFLTINNYNVLATHYPHRSIDGSVLKNIIDMDKLFLTKRVSTNIHNKWIASSHLLCQLADLSCAGSAVARAAYLGIPSIVTNHYYQCLLYPDMVVRSIDDADKYLQDTGLQSKSIIKARELVEEISITNPEYRKWVVELVEKVYYER